MLISNCFVLILNYYGPFNISFMALLNLNMTAAISGVRLTAWHWKIKWIIVINIGDHRKSSSDIILNRHEFIYFYCFRVRQPLLWMVFDGCFALVIWLNGSTSSLNPYLQKVSANDMYLHTAFKRTGKIQNMTFKYLNIWKDTESQHYHHHKEDSRIAGYL